MKLKEITLQQNIILMNEISFLIGIHDLSVNDRINNIIDNIDDDGATVFAEYCKFAADNYNNSIFDYGLEEYLKRYADDLLDKFIQDKIIMTPDGRNK